MVAGNALLKSPCDRADLLQFALAGEAVASGGRHMDNIAPSLFGGLVLTVGIDNPHVKRIPVPAAVRAVVVHPHMFLATSKARAILKGSVAMSDFIWQTANLAGFVCGCYTDDLELIRASFEDVVIEPQRQALIPALPTCAGLRWQPAPWAARSQAPDLRCLPGPGRRPQGRCRRRCGASSAATSLECDSWIVDVNSAGARVLE